MANRYSQDAHSEEEKPGQKHEEEMLESHPIYDTEWVKEIARHSWEPELIISGVAIYLSFSLHDGLDYLLVFFIYDISLDSTQGGLGLPLLIYSVLKAIANILAFTFIIHFMIRALWVATVGLLSVYPKGIQYGKLPFFNAFYKKQLEIKLGRIENFILNLDRIASSIFSTSFLFVITMMGISLIYFLVFILVHVSRLFMERETYETYSKYLFIVLIILCTGLALINLILNLKWFKNNPRYAHIPFQMNWRMGNFIFPGFYRSLQYITLMYYSNVSKTRIYSYGALMMLFFMGSVLYYSVYVRTPLIIDTRSYSSSVEDQYQVFPERYDNLRPSNIKSKNLSIQSDVIKDPYIRLFISYPKYLDRELSDFCPKWELPSDDSKYRKRIFADSSRIACLNRFFEVCIDDKVYSNLNLRFGKHVESQEKGFLAFIPLDSLSQGIHQLSLHQASQDSSNSRPYTYSMPFWYYPQ